MSSSSSPTISTSEIEDYLQTNHPMFWNLVMSKHPSLWKKLSESSIGGLTIFAPTDSAMESLGEKRLSQLRDIRNEETVHKMAEYHAVNEPVDPNELFDAGGIRPVSGDVVPIERARSGGFFGMGGTEDGSITIGGARVVSNQVLAPSSGRSSATMIVYATDQLVSPQLLWRYCDQLRIPGSK
jgi:uncharacterized surface protein with fasciclin (FAS1) repeats